MANEHKNAACARCMWGDVCGYDSPCQHYTPYNYDEIVAQREAERGRQRFRAEWDEYIEYCDDDSASL